MDPLAQLGGVLASVPAPIQTGAYQAINRLIGGLASIPAEHLQAKAQRIRDKSNAQTLISEAVARAAATRASEDPDFVERALESFAGEALRKQVNREAVASEAVENLRQEGIGEEAGPVDEDWMNIFSDYAERASSDRLRQMWGRVLSGEIRKKGSFSLSTLRFISELDQELAQVFQRVAVASVGTFVYKPQTKNEGNFLKDLIDLQDAGLLTGAEGSLSWTLNLEANGRAALSGDRRGLLIEAGDQKVSKSLPVAILSRVGRELKSILPEWDETPILSEVCTALDKNGLKQITLAHTSRFSGGKVNVVPERVLWSATAPS